MLKIRRAALRMLCRPRLKGLKIVDATAIASERAEELRSESHESSKSAAKLDRLAERLRELAATLTNE